MTAALSDARPAPRRGLSRDEAATYVGVGATTFDKLVADGRMPAPIAIGARRVWDIRALDLAFDALIDYGAPAGGTSWDDFRPTKVR